MSEIEIELTKLMVQLMVRYPDGLERIESVFESVVAAGFEICDEKNREGTVH